MSNFMRIIKFRYLWFTLSAVVVLAALFSIFTFGLRLSADYTEGTLYELSFHDENIDKSAIENAVSGYEDLDLGNVGVLETRSDTYVLRLKRLSEDDSVAFLDYVRNNLSEFDKIQERAVSPTVAAKFKSKSVNAVIFVSLMICLFQNLPSII